MKKHLFALIIPVFIIAMFISCTSHGNGTKISAGNINPDSTSGISDKNAFPVISFREDFHDFGKLVSGEKVTYAFKFKNMGKSMLIISNVSTSCGCTISAFPKQPVKPGEEASIDVSFDSEGRNGMQSKMITVFSNTQPATTTLRIQSQVVEPEDN
ncbi:MAG: DUF1573 domain-containing protein [Lentimicrobiaceae bacterium]|jgi:hypothetical protein